MVDTTADEMRMELSGNGTAMAGTRAELAVGESATIIGLEERVVRLERAMTATLDLLQQMRRPPPAPRPADPVKG
jgi:hypothetical protein